MKILICDSHLLFAEALQALFVQRGYEAATAPSPSTAARILESDHDVDVVVMDVAFAQPDDETAEAFDVAASNGRGAAIHQRERRDAKAESRGCAEAVRAVVAADPQVRVVVVTATTDAEALQAAVAEGAIGVAHKAQPLSDLFGIVERVYAGEAVLSGQLMRAALARAHADEHPAAGFLTAREREVLRRLTRGESTRTIAHEMGIAYSTARTHIQSVLDKLGVHSRLEAAAFAARHQI